MNTIGWTRTMGIITPAAPDNLDDLLGPIDPRAATPGEAHFPTGIADVALPLPFADDETVCFGARITEDTKNRVQIAMKLAQMAAEKGAEPIILSHLDYCGLERFGFRVERIAGSTPAIRAEAEAQITRFWNIVMVI